MTPAALDPARPTLDLLPLVGPDADTPLRPTLNEARAYVSGLTLAHYENFSVLSRLVPADLREPFAAVYAFCRWSDDLGDETGSTPEARAESIRLLAWWRDELRRTHAAATDAESPPDAGSAHPVFVALRPVVARHRLPLQPFLDLIDAFEQDQRITRYETWEQLLDYCRRSANPVGRLVLALGGYPDTPENAERYRQSDAICTALQLTNFWQDVRRDLEERDRVYLPRSETGLDAETLRAWKDRPEDPEARVRFIRSLRPLVQHTRALFDEGRPLPDSLDSRIGPVVRLLGAGGEAVLARVERCGCTTLWVRPTLSRRAKLALISRVWLRSRIGRGRNRRGTGRGRDGSERS